MINPIFKLQGMRLGETIEENCESLEQAIERAREWEDVGDPDSGGSYAAPARILDADGKVILDGDDLSDALDAWPDQDE
jgi:hypothetical protein